MSVIYVKGKLGRLARTSLRGQRIPYDSFIPVVPTKFIRRLIEVGDIDVKSDDPPKPKQKEPKPTPPPVANPPSND